ncbi:twin-arginine translocation signal domain-containing protein [Sorangium sp. So ce426]|uniref:twin-arginine translocation signal domain-containing protein n=1 Tax=Sorangium sp. So ce426 TaxID=3133312 RepID=UPI003F5C9811
MTGKLSDFAGLLVAPAVLASLLRVTSRRGFLGAHAAIGAGFSAIKLVPEAARAVEALMALTPLPWRITVDPTDLVALPVLLISYRVLGEAMGRPAPARPVAHRLALMAGSLACVATSKEQPITCGDVEGCAPPQPQELASLVIGNATEAEQLIRVRRLRESVRVDCGVLLDDPTRALSRDLFANAETWLIAPGRALPLGNAGCDATLIDADGLPLTLLAWSAAEFPEQELVTSTESPRADRMITLQRAGARLELADHPAIFPAPPIETPAPAGACGASAGGSGLDWTVPVSRAGVLAGVTSSPDGCHALTLDRGETFFLCAPAEAIPFSEGDVLHVSAVAVDGGRYPELLQDQLALARGLHIESETHAVLALRGNVLARWSMVGRQPGAHFSADLSPLAACGGYHDACGSLVEPLEASLLGDGVSGVVSLRPGESAALAEGAGALFLVRADDMPVRDAECFTVPVDQPRLLESVLVAATAAP